MSIEREQFIELMIQSIDKLDYIKLDDIPEIDLYMDQVTTLMEHKLKTTARNPKEDKILTKTMINNYAKNKLLPSPEKKKYSKDHILILIFIYYFKGFLSISDIQSLLTPLTEESFGESSTINLATVYDEILKAQKNQAEGLKKDIVSKLDRAQELFQDMPEEQSDFLQLFSFIGLLGFDVYFKKLMIERMIDLYLKKDENETT